MRKWLIYQSTEKFWAFKWEVTYSYLCIFQNMSCQQSAGMLLGNNCDQGSAPTAEGAYLDIFVTFPAFSMVSLSSLLQMYKV